MPLFYRTIMYARPYFFLLVLLLTVFSILFTFVENTYSQESSWGNTERIPIRGGEVLDGYIVVQDEAGYAVSSKAYQDGLVGVVVENPAIELSADEDDTYPIVRTGDVYMWVSLANGDIKTGDRITSSPWAGIGMRADHAVATIGIAREDATVSPGETRESLVMKIKVSISPQSHSGTDGPMQGVSSSLLTKTRLPFDRDALIRFGAGVLIIILTIFLSLWFFGGLARSGVDALGRNPKAAKKIQFGITINVLIGFLLSLIGILAALYIMN